MEKDFSWNPYADQPHNLAPKGERFWHHFRYAPSYLSLFALNFRKAFPVLSLYRKYRDSMYDERVKLEDCFGMSISPKESRNEDVFSGLQELGVQQTLIRIPSWERGKLDSYQIFIEKARKNAFDVALALLQQRMDVKNPKRWESFLEDVFSRFSTMCSYFEIGHAWNRTKWGVWDHREYLQLAEPAVLLAEKYRVKLLGPAVIDFEFHLYPPVLEEIPFDKITTLLYVDRVGAPENKQFGWDTSRKVALLKAIVDRCVQKRKDLWITEVNWPIEGTGKYSPAVGRANVSEENQANYLIRYFILCLTSGLVGRIYWWQLVAPGYGLIDSRQKVWRKRPGFLAFKHMVDCLRGSVFIEKIPHPKVRIFLFKKEQGQVAVCWTPTSSVAYRFSRPVQKVENREGGELLFEDNTVHLDQSPKYVHLG